jgi:hypothetical protein
LPNRNAKTFGACVSVSKLLVVGDAEARAQHAANMPWLMTLSCAAPQASARASFTRCESISVVLEVPGAGSRARGAHAEHIARRRWRQAVRSSAA